MDCAWLRDVVAIPIFIAVAVGVPIGLITGCLAGIVSGRMVTYQQTIAQAVVATLDFGVLAVCQTYDDARDGSRVAHLKLAGFSMALICQKHNEAAAKVVKVATALKNETDTLIVAHRSDFSDDRTGLFELASELSICANRWAKEIAVITTPWTNFMNPFQPTRKELGMGPE